MKSFLLFFLIFISIHSSYGQNTKSNYYISAEGGFGYSRYFLPLKMDGLNKNGYSASLSFLWHPEHLLEAGIETGYHHLYSFEKDEISSEFGNTNADVSMVSMPIILLFRMEIFQNIKLHAGSGIILLFNQGRIFNDKFSTSQISIVDHVGISYLYTMRDNFYIGGGIKYTYIFKFEAAYVSFQITAAYKILQW